MKIAIQIADLDAKRIDGTSVYVFNLLKYFGQLDDASEFFLYHKKKFNSTLSPANFANYKIVQKNGLFFWTQTRFADALKKDKPDVLWMPMQALPIQRSRKMKTVITVHDLAFKIFPKMFPKKALWQLNFYADYAIKNADKIIAVSNSTKKDILAYYPKIKSEKIKVIHHGFDGGVFFEKKNKQEKNIFCIKYGLNAGQYLLYVGAIQPRKNLIVLIEAFSNLKKTGNYPELKLVLIGESAWQAKKTLEAIEKSFFAKEIFLIGRVSFAELAKFYQFAKVFVFPSLYEGFGIPILEAFASGIPVICANNSSLLEVAGEAAIYFNGGDKFELEYKIKSVLEKKELGEEMVRKGFLQLQNFSWKKCAQETLEYIKN